MAEYKVSFGPTLESKIPYGDPYWRVFNGSFENMQLEPLDIAALLYDGRPITTWHKANWRTSANYLLGQHLGLDFDTGDKRSTIPHLLRDPFIARHAAIIYTTPSHTPDSPRARVVFLLDTPIQQANNYALASTALLWMFGTADRQCKDAARFFYGGRPGACEMEYPNQELPLTELKEIINQYQIAEQARKPKRPSTYVGQNANETEVLAALKHIDPWAISYDEWLAVLLALHSEFPGANGLQIAESWGRGRDGEVEHKWRGFNTGGNVAGRVGIGTLFKLAKDNGWQKLGNLISATTAMARN